MSGHQFRVGGLAVEPLLQVGEWRDGALAHDQQLAVDHALKGQGPQDVGEGGRDHLAGAGVEPTFQPLADRLHPHAVPLPLRRVVGRVEFRQVVRLVQRLGQHHRPEPPGRRGVGPRAAPFQPGEQIAVGRGQGVPDLLDLRERRAAKIGHGLLGQPRRQPHPQAAGHQLQQGPAPVGVQRVEPAFDERLGLATAGEAQPLDHLRQFRRPVRPGPRRPDQGDGLRQVADIVVGPGEQLRIHARLHRRADRAGLGGLERQVSGQRRERPAPIRVGSLAKKVPDQGQLGVT